MIAAGPPPDDRPDRTARSGGCKFVVVAFEVDDYEIDVDDYSAIRRLKSRRPEARLWLMRTVPQAG